MEKQPTSLGALLNSNASKALLTGVSAAILSMAVAYSLPEIQQHTTRENLLIASEMAAIGVVAYYVAQPFLRGIGKLSERYIRYEFY